MFNQCACSMVSICAQRETPSKYGIRYPNRTCSREGHIYCPIPILCTCSTNSHQVQHKFSLLLALTPRRPCSGTLLRRQELARSQKSRLLDTCRVQLFDASTERRRRLGLLRCVHACRDVRMRTPPTAIESWVVWPFSVPIDGGRRSSGGGGGSGKQVGCGGRRRHLRSCGGDPIQNPRAARRSTNDGVERPPLRRAHAIPGSSSPGQMPLDQAVCPLHRLRSRVERGGCPWRAGHQAPALGGLTPPHWSTVRTGLRCLRRTPKTTGTLGCRRLLQCKLHTFDSGRCLGRRKRSKRGQHGGWRLRCARGK